MSTPPKPAESAAPSSKGLHTESDRLISVPRGGGRWKTIITLLLVVALALAIFVTITRNWNAWEGSHVEQTTDDAYVRGDVTPLSTKVTGIVRTVHVTDFQSVHKGDLIVELQDEDYRSSSPPRYRVKDSGIRRSRN